MAFTFLFFSIKWCISEWNMYFVIYLHLTKYIKKSFILFIIIFGGLGFPARLLFDLLFSLWIPSTWFDSSCLSALCYQHEISCVVLIRTHAASPLSVQMVSTTTVNRLSLAGVGADRVEAHVTQRTRSGLTQTLVYICHTQRGTLWSRTGCDISDHMW